MVCDIRTRLRPRVVTALSILLIGSSGVAAHPHLWITAHVAPRFDAAGLTGFAVDWQFDELASANLVMVYDLDRDSTLSAAESRDVEERSFSKMGDQGYYSVILRDGRRVTTPEPREFRAAIENDTFHYRFFLPFRVAWRDIPRLTFVAFDETYFVDFVTRRATHSVSHGGREIRLVRDVMTLETVGWGRYEVPAIGLEFAE